MLVGHYLCENFNFFSYSCTTAHSFKDAVLNMFLLLLLIKQNTVGP